MAKNTEPDKLSQDASAALAAGMSYGKWKAMQNPVTIRKTPTPEGWKTCVWCGRPFKPKNKGVQKYCESECQRQAQIEKYNKKEAERSTKEE